MEFGAGNVIKMRDDFLSIASHELKTPLTSLKLQVQMLQKLAEKGEISSRAPDRLWNLMDSADRQIARMTNLIDNLMTASTLKSGAFHLEPESIEVGELVQWVVERNRNHPIISECPIQVHAPDHAFGFWDRRRVELALTNLLTNAATYGRGKPIEVSVSADTQRAQVCFRDSGIGIEEKDIRRIFNPFERAVPVEQYGGFGLGLFIAQQIMVAHGGKIQVVSKPSAGSTFTVELPLRSAVWAA
jgi:signal transduction histidine kinase